MGQKLRSLNDLTLPPGDYVLVIPGWYPTRLDPYPGDFNQRQVQAASMFIPQVVLYIGKDTSGRLAAMEANFIQQSPTLVEIVILYPKEKWKAWDVVQSNASYVKLLYYYAALIKKKWGLPKLLHAYIVIRGGLGAWLLSRLWRIRFILSEHWTIYYPGDPGYMQKRNFIFRWLAGKVYKNVSHVLPVSGNLEKHIKKLYGDVTSTVVPNVVDTNMFFYQPVQNEVFRWLHVSTMEYQKNPEGLLRSFKQFHALHKGSVLTMVGPYPNAVKEYAFKLGLTSNDVHFTGPVSYAEVAEMMRQANALVLFSRYENLPCVILEALCCGLPVISTDVGGISEVINPGNGLLVESENETQLTEAFSKLMLNYTTYDRPEMAKQANHLFSYQALGALIKEIYKKLV